MEVQVQMLSTHLDDKINSSVVFMIRQDEILRHPISWNDRDKTGRLEEIPF